MGENWEGAGFAEVSYPYFEKLFYYFLLLSVETQIILRYIQRGFFDRIKSMAISSFK